MYISSVKNPFAQSQKPYTFIQFLWLLTPIHWGCKEHPFFIQGAKWQAIFDFTIKKKITTKSKETANSQVTWSLKFLDHYFVSRETSSKQVLGTLEQLKKKKKKNSFKSCYSHWAKGFLTEDIYIMPPVSWTCVQMGERLGQCHSDSGLCCITIFAFGWTTWVCCSYNSVKYGIYYVKILARNRAFMRF
jgi:hypothetical protein